MRDRAYFISFCLFIYCLNTVYSNTLHFLSFVDVSKHNTPLSVWVYVCGCVQFDSHQHLLDSFVYRIVLAKRKSKKWSWDEVDFRWVFLTNSNISAIWAFTFIVNGFSMSVFRIERTNPWFRSIFSIDCHGRQLWLDKYSTVREHTLQHTKDCIFNALDISYFY